MSNEDKRFIDDIQAIREFINLMNMMISARVNKVVAAGDIYKPCHIGVYKTDLALYNNGLANILVNRDTHEVYGFYSKICLDELNNVLICAKLDVAKDEFVIDIINSNGKVFKSIDTGETFSACPLVRVDSIEIGGKLYNFTS